MSKLLYPNLRILPKLSTNLNASGCLHPQLPPRWQQQCIKFHAIETPSETQYTNFNVGEGGHSRIRGTVVFSDLFKKSETLNFKMSMVIQSHTSRSNKMNFSSIGSRCYELQSKLYFCYPKVIYKIALDLGFTLIIFCSEFL